MSMLDFGLEKQAGGFLTEGLFSTGVEGETEDNLGSWLSKLLAFGLEKLAAFHYYIIRILTTRVIDRKKPWILPNGGVFQLYTIQPQRAGNETTKP